MVEFAGSHRFLRCSCAENHLRPRPGYYLTRRQERGFCFGHHVKNYGPVPVSSTRIAVPIIHISLRAGKSEAYRQAIFDGLYRAMRETLNVPEDDQFMTLSEHEAANFRTGTAYGVARSDDVVYIQFTVFNTRTAEQKKALFKRI